MLTIYYHEIGDSVKNIREWIGMSQKQLALEAGISPASISLLENGTSTNIGLENLQWIFKALSHKPIKKKEYWENTGTLVLSFE